MNFNRPNTSSPVKQDATASTHSTYKRTRISLASLILPAALITIGIASAYLYDYCAFLHSFGEGILVYITIFVAQFGLYLVACYAVLRSESKGKPAVLMITVAIVVVFAATFRAQLVDETPYLSSDVYRYIWDGRVQAAGINPYRYIPEAAELSHLRDDEIYTYINRRDFARTIYPPAAQVIFFGVYLASPSSVQAFKTAMSLFDAVAILAIIMALIETGISPARVIIFAWHPLVIWEGAHSGHIESAAMAFLALALLARVHDRFALTGVALALATLTKFYPALLLPAFFFSANRAHTSATGHANPVRKWAAAFAATLFTRQNIYLLLAFVATILVAYLPYLSVGAGVLGYLPDYLKEEGFVETGSRYFLLSLVRQIAPLPTEAYSIIAALALIGLGVWALVKPKRNAVDIARAATALIGFFLILSSPRFNWYIAWIIPLLCFAPAASWLYLTGASVFLYFLWLTSSYPNIPLWLGAIIYLPTVALLVWERFFKRRDAEMRRWI